MQNQFTHHLTLRFFCQTEIVKTKPSKMIKIKPILALVLLLTACQNKVSFEEQIVNDLKTKVPTGICDSIPQGAVISNIVVGEVVDIGVQGMTDVSYELDYEVDGVKKHHKAALLYLKNGSNYKLAAMGGCEFQLK